MGLFSFQYKDLNLVDMVPWVKMANVRIIIRARVKIARPDPMWFAAVDQGG